MKGRRLAGICLLVWTTCLLSGGCHDAVREGVATGISNGLAGVIEALVDSLASGALDGE